MPMQPITTQSWTVLPLVAALSTALVGCGGGSDASTPANTAPTVQNATTTVQTEERVTLTINAQDAEKQTLSFSISKPPSLGSATIDAKTGLLTYQASNIVGSDQLTVEVSDGQLKTTATVNITTQTQSVFDYQFYRTTNPDTGNVQIVRYDPNNADNATNQTVIKNNVILGSRVFVIRADKNGDQKVYKKREYAVFLDPAASFETRTGKDASGNPYEYKFYTNNILKRFDVSNPSAESVIFTSTMLGADLGGQGLAEIGDSYELLVNETDLAHSYVQLRAFARLPDTLRSETSDSIKNTYVTVRLSDGAMVQGRTLKPIVNNSTGKTDKVLINYSAAHVAGNYPTDAAQAARLKVCEPTLKACTELGDQAKGQFYVLAENSTHVYLTKQGSTTLYAYQKSNNEFAAVTGASFPAPYDPLHHQLRRELGHGGNGVLSDFSSLTITNSQLSEGNQAFAVVNYNLDTQDAVWTFATSPQKMHKNALVLKFEGTTASKIFDNGTGVDLKNDSDAIASAGHLNLIAVKNGNLFVELGRYDATRKVNILSSGWIKAGQTTAKASLDTTVTQQDVPYFTAHHIPTVAVGEHLYVVEVPRDNGSNGNDANALRIYNVYRLGLQDWSSTKATLTPTRGRMFFERTAARSNGVYEGNVLTWNISNGEIRNVSKNLLIGTSTGFTNATGGNTGNMVGIGGMFGMHLSSAHGGAVSLASGQSNTAQSLKIVNQITGSWIFD